MYSCKLSITIKSNLYFNSDLVILTNKNPPKDVTELCYAHIFLGVFDVFFDNKC